MIYLNYFLFLSLRHSAICLFIAVFLSFIYIFFALLFSITGKFCKEVNCLSTGLMCNARLTIVYHNRVLYTTCITQFFFFSAECASALFNSMNKKVWLTRRVMEKRGGLSNCRVCVCSFINLKTRITNVHEYILATCKELIQGDCRVELKECISQYLPKSNLSWCG